jgi:CRISPR-associated protein Csh1
LLEKEQDLSNYYLIYFDVRAKKSKIIDIDFVSNFRYMIDEVKIVEVFPLNGHLEGKTKVKNVFDFEYKIINQIFNNQLMPKVSWRRYFDEMEAHRMTANTYNQLMKYRKSIYDYIFKSRRQAITKIMFDDIMLKGILDDIRLADNESNDYAIKTKLNIWFSLYEYFDYTQFNKPLNKKSMVNKTEELISRVAAIATEANEHLQNDDEFAFAAGQVIHYLLNKSESGNRTHALLEPFLQKTDANLLKREIARCFDMYKHAIKFYAKKYEFDKIMSEVMGYVPDEKNMKNLLPSTLAGYFAKSIFTKKSEN